MHAPDISQHTPRLYQLSQYYGIPTTEVADRLIRYGLENLDAVFDWQPGKGGARVDEVVARVPVPVEVTADGA